MFKFLIRLTVFSATIFIIILMGLILPTTPRAATSLLMAKKAKDALLRSTKQPRIIFVGGSNLSFGLNSQQIKDSLKLNPINTGIHTSIGIRFMLLNTKQYLRKGDIVVVVPEYQQYYRDLNAGSEELLRTITDVNLDNFFLLNTKQIINLLPLIPKYALKKFNPFEYVSFRDNMFYSVNSFNRYGDTYTHWHLPGRPGEVSSEKMSGLYHEEVVKYLKQTEMAFQQMGVVMLVSFPGYQATSFDQTQWEIKLIAQQLKRHRLQLLGNPLRYRIPDSLIFNSPYHLTKSGVDRRTSLFIEDIRSSRYAVERCLEISEK